ncbi:MAG: hypothetical protein AAB348_00590 [Patescibacteria group bacterium]
MATSLFCRQFSTMEIEKMGWKKRCISLIFSATSSTWLEFWANREDAESFFKQVVRVEAKMRVDGREQNHAWAVTSLYLLDEWDVDRGFRVVLKVEERYSEEGNPGAEKVWDLPVQVKFLTASDASFTIANKEVG